MGCYAPPVSDADTQSAANAPRLDDGNPGLTKLAAGESVPIELEFADGEKLAFEAVAREN